MSGMTLAIATIAAGALSAGATAYGSHQANKNARQLKNQQQPLVDQQMANLKFLQPYGEQLANQGQGNMGLVQDYLRKLMSGDRGLTMQTLAPEINALTQQYQGATSAARGMYPRGGQTASQAAQLPYQLQGNINNLLFSARPQAAQQLGTLGSNQASLGLGALGQGGGLTNSMLGYGLQAQNQMFGQGAAIGQGISSMITPFLQYYLMNRPTGTTTVPNLPSSGTSYPQGIMAPSTTSNPYLSNNNPYSNAGG